MYSIIDIETTGISPRSERITEIAVYVHDGEKVVDEFVTLVDPEQKIPYRITQLTGINDRMVKDAPRFCEIARRIVEMTENTTLVGHNVNFDYNFLRNEFRAFGYDFERKKLCTCKLSRKLFPGRRSYSLSNICSELGIPNPQRHRAAGDATATVRLFEILLKAEKNLAELSLQGLNSNLSRKDISRLPEEAGVYYFLDDRGEVIYVGKSRCIRDRVLSHLSNNGSKRAVEMRNQIAGVDFELTGGELTALLLESHEIKKHKPLFNRAQRRTMYQWGLYRHSGEDGYERLAVCRTDSCQDAPLTSFSSKMAARSHLFVLTEAFRLCQKLCGLYESQGACFQYSLNQCEGACIAAEPSESYNVRVNQAISPYRYRAESFLIIENGRSKGELAVIGVQNNRYLGFGYFHSGFSDQLKPEDLLSCIQSYPDNHDVQQIIKSHLRNHPGCRVVYF